MNELKIDKLFRDKLASFEAQPSNGAWEKINGSIQIKRNKTPYWLYAIAASLVLIFTSAIVWINTGSDHGLQVAEIQITEIPVPEPTITAVKENLIGKDPMEANNNQFIQLTATDIKSKDIEVDISLAEESSSSEYLNSIELPILEKRGPQVSNYTAQLNPDFSFIPENDIDLTLPDNEPKIRKAYDFALRVKNGEESLIDIRKAKDNLFAMAKNIKINQSKPN